MGQQFTEGDGAYTWAFDPVRGQERPDPAAGAEMVAGQRLQDGNRGEHLADAEDIHHDVRSHGELRRVRGRAGKAGGNNVDGPMSATYPTTCPFSWLSMLCASRLSEMHPLGVQGLPAEPAAGRVAAGPPAPGLAPGPAVHDAASATTPNATTQIRLATADLPAPGATSQGTEPNPAPAPGTSRSARPPAARHRGTTISRGTCEAFPQTMPDGRRLQPSCFQRPAGLNIAVRPTCCQVTQYRKGGARAPSRWVRSCARSPGERVAG